MKSIATYITGLLMLIANTTSLAQQKENSGNSDYHSLLWRISGEKLSAPSYIFGTIHIICADDYFWTDKMQECLEKSSKVCFEMDINDPSVLQQVAAGLMDKSGKKLNDYFTPEQYKHLQQYMKDSVGMDISLFGQMKPVFLQMLMSVKTAVSCTDPISYENKISETATKDNKEVLGLETPEEQLNVLESMPTDSVIKQITDQISGNSEKEKQEYAQMVTAYKQQDLLALYALIKQSEEIGDNMGVFLDERNKKWIARMNDKMMQSSVFFAVGAGHLYGDNGVINLLRKDGYMVEAVR